MRRFSGILCTCCLLLSACLRGGFFADAGSSSSSDLPAPDGSGDTTVKDAKGFQHLYLEAESGALFAPFAVRDDPQASAGKYLIDHDLATGKHTDGEAHYTVTVLVPGDFHLWGRTRAPATDVDSFFVAVDDQHATAYHTSTRGLSDQWTWTVVGTLLSEEVTPATYTLGAGTHTIVLSSRESGSQIDRLLLTDDLPFNP